MGLSWSSEREKKYFHYTPAYNFTPSYLITKEDSTIEKGHWLGSDRNHYQGKKVRNF